MGIDAQRSGASELPVPAVEVRRAQGATTKAIPVWIVEEEQRRDRPHSGPCNPRQTDDGRAQQDPCALRVAAICTFTTDCWLHVESNRADATGFWRRAG